MDNYTKQEINLLEKVRIEIETNKLIKEANQEVFNVFTVLRKRGDEVLHTAFIGHLLDPERGHGMGNTFLKLFIKRVFKDDDFDCDDNVVSVEQEYSFSGLGRVDIILRNEKRECVVIENKIYATDQKNQLARYKKALEKDMTVDNSNWKILYLSLFGQSPSDKSLEYNGQAYVDETEYINISYSDDILFWLEDCHKEAFDRPTLRETIKQYIFLIKRMTGKDLGAELTNRVDEILKKDFMLSYAISEKFQSNRKRPIDLEMERLIENQEVEEYNDEAEIVFVRLAKVKKDLVLELYKNLFNRLKLSFDKKNDGWGLINELGINSWTGFKLKHNTWSKHFYISIQAQSKLDSQKTILGIQANKKYFDRELLLEVLRANGIKLNIKSNEWPTYKKITNFSEEKDLNILADHTMQDDFISKQVNEIHDMASKLKDVFVERAVLIIK